MPPKPFIVLAVFVAIIVAGYAVFLYRSGYICAIHYVEYAEDGSLSEEGYHFWNRDFGWVKHGHWKNYDRGKVVCEGDFFHGTSAGTWTWQNRDGSPEKIEVYNSDGSALLKKIVYTNGVANVVWDMATMPLPPNISASGTHWDDDFDKNKVIEERFHKMRLSGMSHHDAREMLVKELHLLDKPKPQNSSSPVPPKGSSKPPSSQ